MKRFLGFLLFASLCVAQTIDASGAFNASHGFVRVVSSMDSNPSAPTLEWGATDSYGSDAAMEENNEQSLYTQMFVLMGLTPATTYHWRVCTSGVGSGTCTSDATFTTLAEPSPHPALPVAPEVYDPTYPTINGNTYNVAEGDCNNVSTGLQAHLDTVEALDNALNHEIVIPAGTECIGSYDMPSKTGTGWTLIRSDAVGTSEFPPAGVRLTDDWPVSSITASIKADGFGQRARYGSPSTLNYASVDGTVDTSGTAVTRDSGSLFYFDWKSGTKITIDAVIYVISSVNSSSSITLTSSAGSQSGVSYSVENCTWPQRGGFVTVNTGGFEVFPVLTCNETAEPYEDTVRIASFSGDDPVTVTMDPDHSIISGNVVDIPSNGYVTAAKYLAYEISGDTFKIDTTTIGPYDGDIDLTVYSRYKHPTYTKGSTKPGSCTDEHWFWDTDETWQDLYWCAGGAWTKRREGYDEFAAVHFVSGAEKYWLTGANITLQPVPQEGVGHPTDWEGGNTTSQQGQIGTLVLVDSSTSDIVLDRNVIEGRGYPSRIGTLVRLSGIGPYAITNNSIQNAVDWVWSRLSEYDGTSGINISSGGPIRIENNYLNVAGITVFGIERSFNLTWLTGPLQHDISVVRNHFEKLTSWRRTDGDINYPNRDHVETKAALRVKVDGNIFGYMYSENQVGSTLLPYQPNGALTTGKTISSFTDGTIDTSSDHGAMVEDVVFITGAGGNHDGLWEVASVTDDDTFVLADPPVGTGSAGTVYVRAGAAQISDWDITDNLVYQGTEFIRIQGDGSSSMELVPIQRVRVHNNLVVDLNIDSYATGGRVSVNGTYQNGDFGARFVRVANATEDLTITHNTGYGNWGNLTGLLMGDEVMEGLRFENNLWTDDDSGNRFVRRSTDNGTNALNGLFQRDGVGYYTVDANVVCCSKSAYSGDYPASFEWPATEGAVNWFDPAISSPVTRASDFRLRHDSPYISGGATPASDGLDIGVDVNALEQALGKVSNTRVRDIAATTVTISYLAPDSDSCVVEYSSSATYGTQTLGGRDDDGGGGRVRNVDLTGLTTGTPYYVRVLCAVQQPTLSFVTH